MKTLFPTNRRKLTFTYIHFLVAIGLAEIHGLLPLTSRRRLSYDL